MSILISAFSLFFVILSSFLLYLLAGLCFWRIVTHYVKSEIIQVLTLFFIGGFTLSLLSLISVSLNLSNIQIQLVLVSFVSFQLFLYKEILLSLLKPSFIVLFIWFAYVLFALWAEIGFDLNLHSFSLANVQQHYALPIDNLLQFQTVRYLTEGINPITLDPVPNWRFGDRGPLMGLVISNLFFLFGLTEKLPWLNSSFPAAIVFEIAGVLLNASFIPLIWEIVRSQSNKKVAYLTLLLLLINPFVFVNVVFTWPKFYAASLALLGLHQLTETKPSYVFLGIFFGLGLLAHESIIFSLPAILFFVFYRVGIKPSLTVFGSMLGMQIPWLLYKFFTDQASSNVFIHNALCIKEQEAASQTFLKLLVQTVRENGIINLLNIRFQNLLYPFDLSGIDWEKHFLSNNPILSLAYALTGITFYQFIYAVGLFFMFFYVVRFLSHFRRLFLPVLCLAITVFSVAVFQGCPLSSWNHVWGYLPMLVMTSLIAKELSLIKLVFSVPLVCLQLLISGSILLRHVGIF